MQDYLLASVLALEILDCGAAGEFELKLVGKAMYLFALFLFRNAGRDKVLQADDLGHILVSNLIRDDLDALKHSLSESAHTYLNLFSLVALSDML